MASTAIFAIKPDWETQLDDAIIQAKGTSAPKGNTESVFEIKSQDLAQFHEILQRLEPAERANADETFSKIEQATLEAAEKIQESSNKTGKRMESLALSPDSGNKEKWETELDEAMDEQQNHTNSIYSWLRQLIKSLISALPEPMRPIANNFFLKGFAYIRQLVDNLKNWFAKAFKTLFEWIRKAIEKIGEWFSAIKNWFGRAVDGIKDVFKKGGVRVAGEEEVSNITNVNAVGNVNTVGNAINVDNAEVTDSK